METLNPNITPEGNFTLIYFPYQMDAEPHIPLEEAIQFLFDCWNYEDVYHPWTRKTKKRLLSVINNVLLPACEKGNQDAIYWMYYAYFYGIGVEVDIDKALEYLKMIADYGYPDMQYELGCLYYDCDDLKMGSRSRYLEAARWFEKAADQGWVEAMYMLGTIYDSCRWGVRHYQKRAFVWYKRAAELGHHEAMCSLSGCYRLGYGTKIDRVKAMEWAEKAGWHQEAERIRKIGLDNNINEALFLEYPYELEDNKYDFSNQYSSEVLPFAKAVRKDALQLELGIPFHKLNFEDK